MHDHPSETERLARQRIHDRLPAARRGTPPRRPRDRRRRRDDGLPGT